MGSKNEIEITISPEMISVGVKMLREAGLLFAPSSADPVVVRQILSAALAVRERGARNSTAKSLVRKTPAASAQHL